MIGSGNSPLVEGTDAAGGYLVRDTFGTTLLDAVQRESSILNLCRVDRVPGKRQRYTVYSGRPAAQFVSEGAAKPVTGAAFGEVTVNVKKIATNVVYTSEMLEDAVEDPQILVNADVEAAFADLIDAHALGRAGGSNVTTSFDAMLRSTTASVEYAAGGSGLATAISAALSTVEANGYKPNGIILASDGRGVLRDARHTVETSAPVYTPGFEREPDSIYGLPLSYSSNLDSFATAGAGKIVAFVGDFSQVIAAVRNDITVRFSDQATLVDGATTHNLFQENKVAAQWESRIGLNVHDLNKSIVKITNAS